MTVFAGEAAIDAYVELPSLSGMSVEHLVPTAANGTARIDRVFWWSLACTLALKAVAAGLFPFTGDEAYFVQWGRELAGSYYDHGPVTGWLLWAFLQVGDGAFWLRVPALLTPAAVAWILWISWREYDRERATWAGALVAWSLPALLSVLITTDTPLMLLVTASVAVAARAERTDKPLHYLVAGALLGLAFLAKYFAVLAGLGMAVWWLGVSRTRRWHAVAWLLLGASPFIAQHVYWNYHHSWTNVMFNVFTRQEGAGVSPLNPLLFLVVAGWFLGPVALLLARAGQARWRQGWDTLRSSPLGIFAVTALVGFGVLFLVSIVRSVGLHWLLSFFPLLMVLAVLVLRTDELKRILRPTIWFGVLHLLVGMIVAVLPVEWAKSHRSYVSIVMGVHPEEVLAAIEPHREKGLLATPSYARSALLEYNARERVPVLGPGSFHGRQDDLRTDWTLHDGANITFITARTAEAERARRWFEEAEVREIQVRGAIVHVLVGRGFRYQAYRDDVLAPVAKRYYAMPAFLERWSDGCFFKRRYGLDAPGS